MATDNRTPEEKAKSNAMVANIVKAFGAVFILLAPLVAFNVFGLAELINMHDGLMEYVLGGALLVAGLADFFIVAPLLKRGGVAPVLKGGETPPDGKDKAL